MSTGISQYPGSYDSEAELYVGTSRALEEWRLKQTSPAMRSIRSRQAQQAQRQLMGLVACHISVLYKASNKIAIDEKRHKARLWINKAARGLVEQNPAKMILSLPGILSITLLTSPLGLCLTLTMRTLLQSSERPMSLVSTVETTTEIIRIRELETATRLTK